MCAISTPFPLEVGIAEDNIARIIDIENTTARVQLQ